MRTSVGSAAYVATWLQATRSAEAQQVPRSRIAKTPQQANLQAVARQYELDDAGNFARALEERQQLLRPAMIKSQQHWESLEEKSERMADRVKTHAAAHAGGHAYMLTTAH